MKAVKLTKERRGGWNRGKKLNYHTRDRITERRWQLRQCAWENVKKMLQDHLAKSPKGEATKIANFLGIRASQVHRMSCPICEHNQEPNFSIGLALLVYLQSMQNKPVIIEAEATPWFL